MGKRDPASSLAVFPVSEVPAPTRRRQRSPEGECRAVGKLKRARSLEIRIARIVARAGATRPKFTFPNRPLSSLSFRVNLGTPRPGLWCHLALGAGRTAAPVGGGWVPGVPESDSSHSSPPTNPSQSFFFFSTFPGLARPVRACPRPLGSAPGL